jgi:hypothetical protein
MAFEAEVLNFPGLAVVLYYDEEDSISLKLLEAFNQAAKTYTDAIQCAVIEINSLFKLAQEAVIETTPTIIYIYNREEVARLENTTRHDA